MLSLFLAVSICLLVPWLPVFVYRSLPRRSPPPLSEAELQRLAGKLQTERVTEAEAAVRETDGRTDVIPLPEAWPVPAAKNAARSESPEKPVAPLEGDPRLSLGSYRWLNGLFVAFFLVGFLALGFGWAALLHLLGEAHARTFPPAVFLFTPYYGMVFAVPAIFLGIFSAIPVLMLLARLLLGRRRFLNFLFWDEGRLNSQNVNADSAIAALSRLALFVSVLAAVFVVLVLRWHARFTDKAIVVQPLFGLTAKVHPYETVEQLVITTHRQIGKEVVSEPDLGIRFNDGSTWNTDQTFSLPREPAECEHLIAFLVRKTGKPITRARLLKDLPGW
jgi:hypothetical protein